MNDLQKELNALKAKVAELESRISAEPVVKWQPEGGDFFIQSSGKVSEVVGGSDTPHREFGVERQGRQQAERAAVEMRRFNRLLALRDELCGDAVVDWEDIDFRKYYLFFNHDNGKWVSTYDDTCYETITPYFTSKESAQRACDMLNSGEAGL